MKQEKGLFGGLFPAVAAEFSSSLSLFIDSKEIRLIPCQVASAVFKSSGGGVWILMVHFGC